VDSAKEKSVVCNQRENQLGAEGSADSMSSKATSHPAGWIVYDYEIGMLKHTLNLASKGLDTFQHPIPNAIVESMLLHLRILIDILLSRCNDSDDIRLQDLLPSFDSPLLGQLRTKYGNSKAVGTPCWTLNKMLAHPTTLRSASHRYDPLVHSLVPIVFSLADEIAKAR